jgi:hypothetical protein
MRSRPQRLQRAEVLQEVKALSERDTLSAADQQKLDALIAQSGQAQRAHRPR